MDKNRGVGYFEYIMKEEDAMTIMTCAPIPCLPKPKPVRLNIGEFGPSEA